MEKENEKKGLFARLNKNQKEKKKSSCCNIEIEEIPDEDTKNKNEDTSPKSKGNSCC